VLDFILLDGIKYSGFPEIPGDARAQQFLPASAEVLLELLDDVGQFGEGPVVEIDVIA
jgi:hypothetical protein